jgi:DUF4097 and DUF4098 domain-containing protein YvlB
MKSTFLLLAALAVAAANAQMRDNRDKTMTCSQGQSGGNLAHHCDLREQTIPTAGHLNVDSGKNGGVIVKGWLRNDVLVRSRVETWADTDAEAQALAAQVTVDAGGGQVAARGPESVVNQGDRHGWAVSYEIFVPQTSDLKISAVNGGIAVSDVRGRIEFDTKNGGVHLARIAGDVSGETKNGGVHVELMGSTWEGRQLEVSTRNGGVTLSVPQNYSAHVQTETVNGAINSDFPVTVTGRIRPRPRSLDVNLGSGGALIHVSTTNGGVRLNRI